MESLKVTPVQPIGTEKHRALAQKYERGRGRYHEWVELDMPVFPPDEVARGKRLRDLRMELDLTLRDAALAFGLRAGMTSELEHGGLTCDMDDAERRLRDFAKGR